MWKDKYAEIRASFLNSTDNLLEFCKKNNLNYSNVRSVAFRQGWLRTRKLIQAQTDEAAVRDVCLAHADAIRANKAESDKGDIWQARAEVIRKFCEEDLMIADAIRRYAVQMLQTAKEMRLTPAHLRQIASAAAEAQRIGRLALGISTDNHEVTGAGGGPMQAMSVSLDEYEAALERAIAQLRE